MPRRARTIRMSTPSPRCLPGRRCSRSIAVERPATWAAVPAGSGATAGVVGPAMPADNHRLEHAAMKARTMAGGFAVVTGLMFAGFGYAAAQPGDYSTLPVDPNLITDSLAYNAAPPVFNPNGQPGVQAVYTHRDGSRQITSTILVLHDAQAATVALDGARG